jgi:hypothetical protein
VIGYFNESEENRAQFIDTLVQDIITSDTEGQTLKILHEKIDLNGKITSLQFILDWQDAGFVLIRPEFRREYIKRVNKLRIGITINSRKDKISLSLHPYYYFLQN